MFCCSKKKEHVSDLFQINFYKLKIFRIILTPQNQAKYI